MTSAAAEAAFEQATYDAIIKLNFTPIIAYSTSFRSVSTLRLDGGHYVIRVKVILTIASYVACSKAASAAADDMISCF